MDDFVDGTLAVIVIFLLLTLRRTAADVAGLIGWIVTVLVAWFTLERHWELRFRPAWAGSSLRCRLRWWWRPRSCK